MIQTVVHGVYLARSGFGRRYRWCEFDCIVAQNLHEEDW